MPIPPSGKTPTQRGKRSRASPSPNITGLKKNKLSWADEEDLDDEDLESEEANEQDGSVASDGAASDGLASFTNGYVPVKDLVREIEDVVNECLNSGRILSDSFGARLQESARVIKEQYIEILEENRDLRIKLDKANSTDLSKFEPRRAYRDVLGTAQTTKMLPRNGSLTPSRTKDVKTVVIKLKTPVQDVAQREQKMSDLKNCVGCKLDKYKVDRVLQRSENIIVKAPWNDSDTESAIEKLKGIDGAEIR
ncbi:hypothetical protein FOL47_001576 [Perkinsus chesapeaki]|uniref:Uncharacterized protein n=1 Tax=Perkinsus chesapeaki TaxID=330153 RepID=A0A7J6KSA1_PERCH|nr:hypothetical protein FOL47_001576 [Perkinsus chesapeaki]